MFKIKLMAILALALNIHCTGPAQSSSSKDSAPKQADTKKATPVVGAAQLNVLMPMLKDKAVALVVNHTTLIGRTHLADTLKSLNVNVRKIFAPEHGFRGTAADGEQVKDGIDVRTGFPIVSLYGSNKKPTAPQLADVDVVIFDIQDVGVRFYTYISTMHYVMEACAEQNKKVIVLDRPNPNGNYFDGPVLDPAVRSFVGMHTIPLVHGLTVGELAKMINGEGWLNNGVKCSLDVITVKNWKHADEYSLTTKPSPNMPNDQAIKLYPSLGLFEGTTISVGRGTQIPFLVIGNPELKNLSFTFTPQDIEGMSQNPPHEGKLCYGIDLRNVEVKRQLTLKYLLDMYKAYPDKEKFFNANNFFDKLAGTTKLQQQVKDGLSEEAIRKTWENDLKAYAEKRKQYLLYP